MREQPRQGGGWERSLSPCRRPKWSGNPGCRRVWSGSVKVCTSAPNVSLGSPPFFWIDRGSIATATSSDLVCVGALPPLLGRAAQLSELVADLALYMKAGSEEVV